MFNLSLFALSPRQRKINVSYKLGRIHSNFEILSFEHQIRSSNLVKIDFPVEIRLNLTVEFDKLYSFQGTIGPKL